jgi:hypothetical protein
MSIYVMTVGELAKKRGEPVGEFVKKLQDKGFAAGSHAKRLTQPDLDLIIGLLDGSIKEAPPQPEAPAAPIVVEVKAKENKRAVNPNVLIIRTGESKSLVALVDASLDEAGNIKLEVLESSEKESLGETLLEFRKLQGMKMGVN